MPSKRVSLRDYPRLTRFYGIGPAEIASIPHNILAIYAEEMPVLAAEDLQSRILAADMPYAGSEDRKRVFNSLGRLTAEEEPEKIDIRTEEGVATAASFGIAVIYEQPEDDSVESHENA